MIARRTLILVTVALLGIACSPAPATTADTTTEPDVEPVDVQMDAEDTAHADVLAVDVEAPDVPPDVDAQPDASDGAGAVVIVTADTKSLTPAPLSTWFTAIVDGKDVTSNCTWSIGPPEVCVPTLPNGAFRKGFGTCVAKCVLPSGGQGTISLNSAPQPVLYVLGGWNFELLAPDVVHPGISRLRVNDKQWDANVAPLPYVISNGAVGGDANHLYVVGGNQAGGSGGVDVPVGQCPSDLPGCTGDKCLSPCIVTSFGQGPVWTCPKESVAKPALGGGCGTIWRLDLADASWHAVGSLTENTTFVGGAPMVGTKLFLSIGGVLDVVTGLQSTIPGTGLNTLGQPIGFLLAPFGDTVVATGHGTSFNKRSPVDGTWTPFSPQQPCSVSVAAGVSFTGFQVPVPTLVWSQAWSANQPECPSMKAGPGQAPLAFRTWLSTDGNWQPGPALPGAFSDVVEYLPVSSANGVFFLPMSNSGSTPASSWLLVPPGDHFEEYPPVPHASTTMAVVVTQ